jgi:hypothetical protein
MFKGMTTNITLCHRFMPTLLLALGMAVAQPVLAEDSVKESNVLFTLTPDRCIALNEGQNCYQTVNVEWQTVDIDDVCLIEGNATDALYCWEAATEGSVKLAFESAETVTYTLHLKRTLTQRENPLAQATVEVTWVYSKTKKRRNSWRLF